MSSNEGQTRQWRPIHIDKEKIHQDDITVVSIDPQMLAHPISLKQTNNKNTSRHKTQIYPITIIVENFNILISPRDMSSRPKKINKDT
jgi:hypothetical protein